MEQSLFTITCTTCQARLAVRDPALVGQIVSCPKCQSMVQVTPPAGWATLGEPRAPGGASDTPVGEASAPSRSRLGLETRLGSENETPVPRRDTPARSVSDSDASRWTRAAGVVPPPLPTQRPTDTASMSVPVSLSKATDSSTAASDSDLVSLDESVGTSPTASIWQKAFVWVGLPLVGIVIVAAVLAMVFSGGPSSDNDEPDSRQTAPSETSKTPPTEEKTSGAKPAEKPPSAEMLDATWVPDDARLVVSLAPSRLARRSGTDRLLEAAGPIWNPVLDRVLKGLALRLDELKRVTWSTADLDGFTSGSVVAIEVEEDCDLGRLAEAGETTGTQFRGAACRRLTQSAWSQPFALVGPHTIVTGEAVVLKTLANRREPRLTSHALAKLLDAAPRDVELTVLVDLEAARRAGWQWPERVMRVWPAGERPWRTIWQTSQALGVDLRPNGGSTHGTIELVCADVPAAAKALAAIERLVPMAKATLAEKVKVRSVKADQDAAAEAYSLLLQETVEALGTTHGEQLDATVRVSTDWGQNLSGIGLLALDNLSEIRRDWTAAAKATVQGQASRLVAGLDDYRRLKGVFPAAAVGGSLFPPETRLSWIATLLPRYGHDDWHKRLEFGYSWDDDKNAPVTRQILPEVVNPAFGPSADANGFPVTHYVGSAGVGAGAAELGADDARAGLFGYGRETRPSQLRDGASNTIAILGACGDAGPWAAGGRATARALTQRPYVNGPDGFGTGQPDGMYVGMADGSVRFLAKDVDPRIVEELVTINGGEKSREPVDAKEPAEAAQAQAPETKPATDDEANEVEEKEPTAEEIPPALATKLARPIEDAKFEDMELGDLVQLVREMGSLEIQIDQASLAKAEVSLDTSVTVELKKTTLGDVLDEALRQCGLALVAREGRLVVTVAEP